MSRPAGLGAMLFWVLVGITTAVLALRVALYGIDSQLGERPLRNLLWALGGLVLLAWVLTR